MQRGKAEDKSGADTDVAEREDWMKKLRTESKVKIMINFQEGHEGKSDVPVGINGHVYLIQRGQEVDIPESVYQNLVSCKYEILSKGENGQDIRSNVPRFSYSVIERKVKPPEPEPKKEEERQLSGFGA